MRSSSNDWLLLFFFSSPYLKIGIKESNISHHETYRHTYTQTEHDKRMFNNCLYLIIKYKN